MKGNQNGLLAVIAILAGIIGYVAYTSRNEQGFESKVVLDTRKSATKPYSEDAINSLAQYEEERGNHAPTFEEESVFTNEGDRQVKKGIINELMKRYPLDWSNQPPSSSKFQAGQAKFIESFTSPSLPEPFAGSNLSIPDTRALEAEEKRIIATYAPKHADDLSEYHIDDANALISKIYKAKGRVPEVVRKEGNIFEVVRTRSLKDKILCLCTVKFRRKG
jgi:uncharacterized protein (UPF0333 family)